MENDEFEDVGTAENGVLSVMLDAGASAVQQGRVGPSRPLPPQQTASAATGPSWHETLRSAAEVTMNGGRD